MTDIKDVLIENESLKARNEFLERCVRGLKLHNHEITKECNQLCERNMQLSQELQTIKQMSMFEFGNKYCSSESLEADGHAFARSLLGHRMTDEEVAIEAAEDRYVPYTGDDF